MNRCVNQIILKEPFLKINFNSRGVNKSLIAY